MCGEVWRQRNLKLWGLKDAAGSEWQTAPPGREAGGRGVHCSSSAQTTSISDGSNFRPRPAG